MNESLNGHDKPSPVKPNWTVAHAFGEIVWLMTQSGGYKHHSLADLEWIVMPALLLEQYRIFHEGARPVGAITWARLNAETGAAMADGRFRLRPDQWRCGDDIWIVDIITGASQNPLLPAGMVEDFKKNVFPALSVWLRRLNAQTQSIDIIELRQQEVAA
jgi:cytolysin-activating lysine-acyltransferase